MAQLLDCNSLHFHPQNTYFFDDITGDRWEEFLDSVRARGIITPIIVSNTSVVVSGHQRLRACLELGIPQIACEVRMYNNEDDLLQDLLETNIRQRGTIGNTIKMGRIAKELLRLYGVEDMGKTEGAEARGKIAALMGKRKADVSIAKRLTNLDERIQQAIETGKIPTIAGVFISSKYMDDEINHLALALHALPQWNRPQLEAFLYLLQTDPEKVQTLQQSDYKGLEELLASPTLNVTVEAAPDEIEALRAKVKETETALKAKEAAIQGAEEALKAQSDAFDQERAMAARNLEAQVQREYVAEEKAARLTNGTERQEFIDRIKRLEVDMRQQYERAADLAKKNAKLTKQLEQASVQEAAPVGLPSANTLDMAGLGALLGGFLEALEKYYPVFESANNKDKEQYSAWLLEASDAIDDAYKLLDTATVKQAG